MSKMNAVRLININYNNNAIRISDEEFHFNGESTLLSLRNGGGKSVLVQMLTAPFVHKRYRDAKDRPFAGYFTTNKPSFILVEWVLDQQAGYVLTGLMVRKSQDNENGEGDDLEMIGMVSEYREPCLQDIHHLPVVEKGKKEMVLKNYGACRQMFESYKKDHSLHFFYYDMNNAAQSRQYFEKLREYQIHYKEWESIIKKVNLKESGLSELFADCRDEKGLVEKWFLDAVESKLNKERNRMKEFQIILEKYVGQYKDNRSKIQRRDTIRRFKEEAVRIEEKAAAYREGEEKEEEQENLVAHFIARLEQLLQAADSEREAVLAQLEKLHAKIARIEYERISGEIHELERQLRFHLSNRDMIAMEQESLEREAEEISRKLHLFACAKQQRLVREEQAEWEEVLQKLEVVRRKNVNLEPERHCLGHVLYCHYEREAEENRRMLWENQKAAVQVSGEISREKEAAADLEERLRKEAGREGALTSNVQSYDRWEEQFNVRYRERLTRNILGEYEPGTLEIFREGCAGRLEELLRERIRIKKAYENAKEDHRRQERKLSDLKEEQIRTAAEKERQEHIREIYTQELEARKVILKYLDLEERLLFDTEKILHASGRKLSETANLRRNLEKEEDLLQKEFSRLTNGQVLELSKELEEELSALGLHLVYGMEWLRKNGYSEAENLELVRRHPFLPYALILSEAGVEKLSGHAGEIYTSFPIPIIVREHLEQEKAEEDGSMHRFGDISFYMLFNENLLNEEKLQGLTAEKERQIIRKQEAIRIREEEYRQYFERQEQVKNQTVSRENYDANERALKETEEALGTLDESIREVLNRLAEQKALMERQEKEIRKAEQEHELCRRKSEDFEALSQAYAEYTEHRRELEHCRRGMEKLREKQKLTRARQERLEEKQRTLETEKDLLLREQERQQEELRKYQQFVQNGEKQQKEKSAESIFYQLESGRLPETKVKDSSSDAEDGIDWKRRWETAVGKAVKKERTEEKTEERNKRERTAEKTEEGQKKEETTERTGKEYGDTVEAAEELRKLVSDMEGRYAAITAAVSLELQELERQEQRCSRRYKEAEEELEHLRTKYCLPENAWEEIRYNRKEEQHQEIRLEDRQRKLHEKQSLWNEEDKRIAVITQQKEDLSKRMKKECGKEQPLPEAEIQDQDFEGRKNQLLYQEKELQRSAEKQRLCMQSLNENLTALAEYSGFAQRAPVVWEQDFAEMSSRELRDFKGILIRDYNQSLKKRQEAKEKLIRVLNDILRMEDFQEEFYKKPLEAMLELSGDAVQVRRQLQTTIQSYDSLMEKLEVDISLVEKEKNKIAGLLEDYIRDVHQNLGRIDCNSTITIRDRSVKMLKIQLPSWEENESLYQIRLRDMIDEITQKGITLFEKNENAQEYFGTKITTKNLYDMVIGIGNVQIRLYKIEAQREYPITWNEVAKNSGGEGFLSAFVILSSLLYYMRKDDTDIFADRNEGKVLLMDNPFAQTNASHLLKPLMDVAKKTNTQLICLTGLGGESIYNRFDNIYVLNLIAANLRNGMQYLRADHLRGEEPDTMVVSQIEVLEQQELIF